LWEKVVEKTTSNYLNMLNDPHEAERKVEVLPRGQG
jgi:hypothetical protein